MEGSERDKSAAVSIQALVRGTLTRRLSPLQKIIPPDLSKGEVLPRENTAGDKLALLDEAPAPPPPTTGVLSSPIFDERTQTSEHINGSLKQAQGQELSATLR